MKTTSIVLLVGLLLIHGCASKEDEKDRLKGTDVKAAPVPVSVDVVRMGVLEQTIHYTGQVAAWQDIDLIAKVEGGVLESPEKEGQSFRKGRIVYKIDPATYTLALSQAQLAVDRALVEYQLEIDGWEGEVTDEAREMIKLTTGLKEAELSLEQARQSFDNSVIIAPFDCRVAELTLKVGDIASTGNVLCRLVNTDRLKVLINVGENEVVRIREGAAAWIAFPALGSGERKGSVYSISPVISSETRGCGIEIALPDGEGLKPGMYAQVRVVVNRIEDAVVVPVGALLIRDERPLIFLVKEGKSLWQYVEAGARGDDLIEISEGASPGDTVIVSGHYALAHDKPVTALPVEDGE